MELFQITQIYGRLLRTFETTQVVCPISNYIFKRCDSIRNESLPSFVLFGQTFEYYLNYSTYPVFKVPVKFSILFQMVTSFQIH